MEPWQVFPLVRAFGSTCIYYLNLACSAMLLNFIMFCLIMCKNQWYGTPNFFYFLAGYIRDVSGSYNIPFYIFASLSLLAAVLFVLAFLAQRKEKKNIRRRSSVFYLTSLWNELRWKWWTQRKERFLTPVLMKNVAG